MSNASPRPSRKVRLFRTLFLDLLADRRSRPIFIYVALIIVASAAIFHWLEGWDWLDAIYFVVITFTTIGYGDFTPTTPVTKVITIFVALNGVVVLLTLFDEIRRVRAWDHIGTPANEEESDGLSDT